MWPQLGLDRDQFIDLARHRQPGAIPSACRSWRCASRIGAMRSLSCTGRCRPQDVALPCGPIGPRTMCRSRISPTACIPAPGWRAACAILYDRYLGADWMEHVDDPDIVGAVEQYPRRTSSGRCACILSASWSAYMRERARQQWLTRRGASGPGDRLRRFARSVCPDHRLCPPFCHLQTRQPDPARSGPAVEDHQPTRTCRCRSSLPASRIPTMKPASC